MKKTWKTRLFALLLCLSMLLPFLPETVQAAGMSYVALGDSITTGYGLADDESNFATLLTGSNYSLDNLAAAGETSQSLLAKLSDNTGETCQAVKNADLITITIGGNDLMNALYTYLAGKTGLSSDEVKNALTDKADPNRQKVLLGAMSNISGFASSPEAAQAMTALANNFSAIIGAIRTANPDVTLIVANQYNPYSHLEGMQGALISSAFEAGIASLNRLISSGAANGGYIVADIYTAFKNAADNPCNAYFNSIADMELDFHPNAYGHLLIATTILNLDVIPINGVTASRDAYDRNGFVDVEYTLSHPDGISLTEIKIGEETLTEGEAYTLSGDTVTMSNDYLGQQKEGETLDLTFCFTEGNTVTKSLLIPETCAITVNSDPVDCGYFSVNGFSDSSTNVYYAVKGEEIELGASAYDYLNYEFDCWKLGDEILSEDEYLTITPTSDMTLTMAFSSLPCLLTLSPAELDFGVVDVTYDQPDARTVTITNTGENTVAVMVPSSEHFVVDELSDEFIDPGSSATFTVQPAANLAEGKYSESIPVYAVSANIPQPRAFTNEVIELPEDAIAAEVKVSFQVGKDPVVTTETNKQTPTKTETASGTPKTGDSSHAGGWLLLLLASGFGAGAYLVCAKKRKA